VWHRYVGEVGKSVIVVLQLISVYCVPNFIEFRQFVETTINLDSVIETQYGSQGQSLKSDVLNFQSLPRFPTRHIGIELCQFLTCSFLCFFVDRQVDGRYQKYAGGI